MTTSVPVRREHERWSKWWWTLVLIPPIAAVLTSLVAPGPHGHWSEHLGTAVLKGAQLVLLLVLVTTLGWTTLRVLLLTAFAAIAVGIVLQVIGDYQVAGSIWRTTGDPGFGIGYTEGHERSELGDVVVLLGGVIFAVVAGVTRRVPALLAVVAVVMVILPPPFFWPAAGVLVLVLYGLTSASRFERPTSGLRSATCVVPMEA